MFWVAPMMAMHRKRLSNKAYVQCQPRKKSLLQRTFYYNEVSLYISRKRIALLYVHKHHDYFTIDDFTRSLSVAMEKNYIIIKK